MIRPKKSFGQHFLADAGIARRIAGLATSPGGGTVVEIGAGEGALTRHLLGEAGRVVALERDRELVPVLEATFAREISGGLLVVRETDAKSHDWSSELVGPAPRVVCGNVPYNITGALVERAVHLADMLDRVVFMVQREVAERMGAQPGTAAYGAQSVFVQAAYSVEVAFLVRAGAFRPPPRVDSAVVVLSPLRPRITEETETFRELVHRAFEARRKTLRNAWRGVGGLPEERLRLLASEAGIGLELRGEVLSPAQFAGLASRIERVRRTERGPAGAG